MPGLIFDIQYLKNENLTISPDELLDNYFYGIQIKNSQGTKISNETVKNFILSAQEEIEHYLNIKLSKQVITEDKDFHRNDWQSWGYIRTTYPVVKPISLDGYINTIKQITYPQEWLSSKKTSDGELYHRHLYLVPSSNASIQSSQIIYSGITPHLGFMGNQSIPNYWTVSYETGFCRIPRDLMSIIGMMASLQLFLVMGDILLSPGVNSQSISIDGLSQNISTQGAFKTRIDTYLNQIKESLPKLSSYYKGFVVSSF